MKAEELKKMIEDYKKDDKGNGLDIKKSNVEYGVERERAKEAYLKNITPISQYINEQFSNIKDGKKIGK